MGLDMYLYLAKKPGEQEACFTFQYKGIRRKISMDAGKYNREIFPVFVDRLQNLWHTK